MARTNTDPPVILHVEEDSHICRITLNRPRSLNAINVPLLSCLVNVLKDVHVSGVTV